LFLILTLGVLSLVLSLVLTPIVRDYVGKLGFLDHPDGVRKRHASPIPRVGGIAIVAAYVTTFGIALALPFSYTHLLHSSLPTIIPLTLIGSIVFLTGIVDDLVGLTPWQKLMGIGGASILAYWAGIRVNIHAVTNVPAWPWLSFLITVVWLIGCTNAFNLIDGMDGLAAGVGLVSALTMLLAALTQNNLPLALATMPLAGCLLGFLRYNFSSASVFLGDSGSLLIGFLMGCYGAFWSEKSVTLVALTVPLLAVSIPLLDVLISISRRFLRNRPIFQADRGHIHHKLVDLGLTPKRAVLTMYGVCALVATLSLVASALHNRFSGLVVIVFCFAAWFGIRRLEYAEFAMASKMFLGGKFRRIIDAETRLKDFETTLEKAQGIEQCWRLICACSTDLGFRGVRMSIQGAIFEDFSAPTDGRLWQIRIPLANAHYINFFRDFDREMNPVILSAFVIGVERILKQKIQEHEEEIVRMPAAKAAFYYRSSARVASSRGD
jgi:UDP-GlcNAc:undecaprenyl-phosphate/decaprenyl-phosphate GlcNAc-1-phosphate transferase